MTKEQATVLQEKLRDKVVTQFQPRIGDLFVALALDTTPGDNTFHGAAVVYDRNTYEAIFKATTVTQPSFPYFPGLLAFREVPSLLKTWEEIPKDLQHRVSFLLVDGHGITHPKRIGVASHLGIELGIPSIGVTRNILVGKLVEDKILVDGEVRGTKFGDLYISPGHKVSVNSAHFIVEHLYRFVDPVKEVRSLAENKEKHHV